MKHSGNRSAFVPMRMRMSSILAMILRYSEYDTVYIGLWDAFGAKAACTRTGGRFEKSVCTKYNLLQSISLPISESGFPVI